MSFVIPYGDTGCGRTRLRGRVGLRIAVDRRRRGEDDANAVAGRRLEEALRGEHVALEVRLEHVAEAAHARLTGEVEDPVEAGEVDRIAGEVEPQDLLATGVLLLQRDVVVVGEAVEPDDLVPLGLQCLGEMRADEAGGAGDEVSHRRNCRGYAPVTATTTPCGDGTILPRALAALACQSPCARR